AVTSLGCFPNAIGGLSLFLRSQSFAFQGRFVFSPGLSLPVRIHCPRGETAMAPAKPVPLSFNFSVPASTFHTRAVLSNAAVARYLPSSKYTPEGMVLLCPSVTTCSRSQRFCLFNAKI